MHGQPKLSDLPLGWRIVQTIYELAAWVFIFVSIWHGAPTVMRTYMPAFASATPSISKIVPFVPLYFAVVYWGIGTVYIMKKRFPKLMERIMMKIRPVQQAVLGK